MTLAPAFLRVTTFAAREGRAVRRVYEEIKRGRIAAVDLGARLLRVDLIELGEIDTTLWPAELDRVLVQQLLQLDDVEWYRVRPAIPRKGRELYDRAALLRWLNDRQASP